MSVYSENEFDETVKRMSVGRARKGELRFHCFLVISLESTEKYQVHNVMFD